MSTKELMLLNYGVGEDCWESFVEMVGSLHETARRSNQSILRMSVWNIHWKDWCWSWNFSTLATWCEKLIHVKRPQCWERLKAGREGDNRGWDGWMASPTQLTWVWGHVQESLVCCSLWIAKSQTWRNKNNLCFQTDIFIISFGICEEHAHSLR